MHNIYVKVIAGGQDSGQPFNPLDAPVNGNRGI